MFQQVAHGKPEGEGRKASRAERGITPFRQGNRTACNRVKIAVCQLFQGEEKKRGGKKKKGFAARVCEKEDILMRSLVIQRSSLFPFQSVQLNVKSRSIGI